MGLLKAVLILVILSNIGCTDAAMSKYTTLGRRAEVVCLSGGKVYFHGISTGRVENESQSNGYYAVWEVISAPVFKHIKTGDTVPFSVSDGCAIGYPSNLNR
tara:strand:- start:903 stop:1208 length:306 start_codon:yes stop_codon:yes gene_type:complete